VNFRREVSVSLDMALDDPFKYPSLKIGPRNRPRIQKDFPNIFRQPVPIPHSKMIKLVSAEKESFKTEWREHMIDLRQPMRHSVVVRVLRFRCEVEYVPLERRCH